MGIETLKQRIAREIGTPALVVDLDVVERNIAKTQGLCDAAGVANRPHIKTHKSNRLMQMQLEAGAKGITCQKLGEAEVMAEGGATDIFISYNLLGDEKMARLARLMQDAEMTVAADNPLVVTELAKAAAMAGRELRVRIECDTGRKRAGVETTAEAIALGRMIAATPGLKLAGLMVYPPENAADVTNAFVAEVKAVLAGDGITFDELSSGGTPNLLNLGSLKGQTEHRAGTSIFNDRMMMAAGFASQEDCALTVYTTVVSRGGPERGILDAGSKTLTTETGWDLKGHGFILEHPEAMIARFAEEHGMLDLSRCNDRPVVGEVVRVIPNHICPVVNVVGELVYVRGDEIISTEDVAARGKLR
ncbi:MAG: D-TA family PLP-dependent enzyme [Beijerinckiaceae bacterium]|jgi:D-serine deaminase-like pyridoxal phosphate-dependent protein|nr:D-TA family PLP-dependent enzyme [Beijerinckiaceae bacterium]